MTNKYVEHLQVLVEDDANRQLINGLALNPSVRARQLQVLPVAGGWTAVLDRLADPVELQRLASYPKRHLLLLIDFDNQLQARLATYQARKGAMPEGVADRIYLLGCLHEPEKLKAACSYAKSIEKLGQELSEDCTPAPAQTLWQHPHMQHNASELNRLVAQVKPFLHAF